MLLAAKETVEDREGLYLILQLALFLNSLFFAVDFVGGDGFDGLSSDRGDLGLRFFALEACGLEGGGSSFRDGYFLPC